MGSDEGADLAVLFPADGAAQELDLHAGSLGVVHVCQGDGSDALSRDLFGRYLTAPGQRGQDANLTAGVMTLDVSGGIALSIAVVLSLLQGVLKGETSLDHTGQDIVGGAVQDAGELVELIGSQAGTDGLQDGNTAAHAGLEQIGDVLLLGQLHQLAAVLCHQLLVR